ncbi:UNVERIFIED_CONTAM: hypothetical protein Slati_1117800 [Sesamum latifolium]|uniref:Uncharacterized protein n=1 Tax=Sesamum latifolium TaxID=2727402 RepID=A0AAW2XEZ4_9LAMI
MKGEVHTTLGDGHQVIEDVVAPSQDPEKPAAVMQELGDMNDVPEVSNDVQEVDSRLVNEQTEARTTVVGLAATKTHDALPGCVENTSVWTFSQLAMGIEEMGLAPTGAGVIQTDDVDVSRMMACHRQVKSMGDEHADPTSSSNRELEASPPSRVVTRSRRYQRSARRHY